MAQTVRVLDPTDQQVKQDETAAFLLDVLVGLSSTRKYLPSKYLYDKEGSRLFDEITELEEYYPTNCEIDAMTINRDGIARLAKGEPFNLIEFGPGNGLKTSILIENFLDQKLDFKYFPIDISQKAIDDLLKHMGSTFPELELNALVTDYFTGINWLNNQYQRKNVVLFLGSNIGNFTHNSARFFMRNLWNCLNNGDMVLTGFDLKKDIELLLQAYNDSKGITAAFNVNILYRINRELGGQFDPAKFRHFGTYDVFSGAMESYLVSLEEQEVFIEEIGRSFTFHPWEPIHIEYSYKYLISDIDKIAHETGYEVLNHFFDSKRYFVDSMWRVKKQNSAGDGCI